MFKRNYPQVFTQAGFVTSLPFDTRESMLSLTKYAQQIKVDYPAFQVIAPSRNIYLLGGQRKNLDIKDSRNIIELVL